MDTLRIYDDETLKVALFKFKSRMTFLAQVPTRRTYDVVLNSGRQTLGLK